MSNFWQDIKKPVFALAPMEDVTDTVFRELILSISDPAALNVVFTEFTSTEGICHEQGRLKVMERLVVSETEKQLLRSRNTKIVAQIWGSDPEKFSKSAKIISDMGLFDGIDINMGCPVKKVIKNISCSALINHPLLAQDIVRATIEASSLPVSVKTRLGFKTVITEEWISNLLQARPAAITIHGRTQKMMSYGPVLWEEIAKAVTLRNLMGSSTLILGNGDIRSHSEGLDRIRQFSLDGIMVGTGVFHNPWIFNLSQKEPGIEERIELLIKHILLFRAAWAVQKNFNILKRFFKIYLAGFRGAVEWRDKFMKAPDYETILDLTNEMKQQDFYKSLVEHE